MMVLTRWISAASSRPDCVVAAVLLFFFWGVQVFLNRRLVNSLATGGIVSLQLAGTSSRAQAVLDSWDPKAKRDAIRSVWWDFGFIVAYCASLMLLCIWATYQNVAAWDWNPAVGPTSVLAVFVAAVSDIVENLALFRMLRGGATKARAGVAGRAAFAKFALLAAAIGFVASGFVAWWPYLGAFVRYATTHLGFVLVLVLVYGIVYGKVGTGNGIPSLFWHDKFLVRVSASAAVTLLLLDLGVISFYEVRDRPDGLVAVVAGPPPWAGEADTPFDLGPDGSREYRVPPPVNARYLGAFLRAASYIPLGLLAFPALAPIFAPFLPNLFPAVPLIPLMAGGRDRFLKQLLGGLAWLLGISAGVAIAWLLLLSGPVLHAWAAGSGPSSIRTLILIFYLCFLIVYGVMSFTPVYRIVSPAAALSALFAVVAMTYAMVTYFDGHFFPFMKDWWLPPRLVLLIGLLALFGWANNDPFKLRFPKMEAYYPDGTVGLVPLREAVARIYQPGDDKIPAQPEWGVQLIEDRRALDAWLGLHRPHPDSPKPRLVVLSVSGGATRSAYWVGTVLDQIEAEIPEFPAHVRIITGASGGMVGTAFFVKELADRIGRPGHKSRRYKEVIPVDNITAVARYIALREVPLSLVPFPIAKLFPFLKVPRVQPDLVPIGEVVDRGIILEGDWGATRRHPDDPRIGLPIQAFKDLEAEGRLPSLILSPMMVDDGRRLLISNLDLWELSGAQGGLITEVDAGTRSHDYSLSAFEFFRLFPGAKDFHLATAVRMSASFPFVSPAVNLPTDPPRRVVDAGYYDNYGVQVSTAWLQKNVDWLIENTSGVVLVQIRDAISQKDRLEVADEPTGWFATIARGFQFFTSPLDAASKARYTVSAFQDDQAVEDLSRTFRDKVFRKINPSEVEAKREAAVRDAYAFFTTVTFENSAMIVYGSRPPDHWPGDDPDAIEPNTEVALDWYLSRAERDGLDTAIPVPSKPDASPKKPPKVGPRAPQPPSGSDWTVAANRLARIAWLREMVAETHGTERDRWLNELEQARNRERLVQLKGWWQRRPSTPKTVDDCPLEAFIASRSAANPEPNPAPGPHVGNGAPDARAGGRATAKDPGGG